MSVTHTPCAEEVGGGSRHLLQTPLTPDSHALLDSGKRPYLDSLMVVLWAMKRLRFGTLPTILTDRFASRLP